MQGQMETSHRHDPEKHNDHLLFVSFPCNVSDFSDMEERRVQRFNVVHALDSRKTTRHDAQTSTLWQVSAHLSRALVCEETRAGFLSRESKQLAAEADGVDGSSFSLARTLKDLFEGVSSKGCCALQVNNILCQVSVFPKGEDGRHGFADGMHKAVCQEAISPPTAEQALSLTVPREELLSELPLDSSGIVPRMVKAITPRVSLGELEVHLALPLSTLQRVAVHLVYWKKARVVDVFQLHTWVAPVVWTC